jgi:cytochrome c oxidase cbb3-type subunit I
MWRATNPDGTLTYTFIESVRQTYPYYVTRVFGGLMFLSGMLIMVWNVWKTCLPAREVPLVRVPAPAHA